MRSTACIRWASSIRSSSSRSLFSARRRQRSPGGVLRVKPASRRLISAIVNPERFVKGQGIPGFPSDEVALRYQTIKGVRAVDYHSFQRAVRLIESGTVPIHKLHTHHYPLEAAADAVRSLTIPGERPAISITIEP